MRSLLGQVRFMSIRPPLHEGCYPFVSGGLQIGGGIDDQNAQDWLTAGASKV